MTISADTPDKKTYPGDGSTTEFEVVLEIQSADQLKVAAVNNTTGVETKYTLNALSNGFSLSTDLSTLTITDTVPVGSSLVLTFDIPLAQGLDLEANRAFPPEAVESVLDKLVLICKQIDEETGRALKLSVLDSTESFNTDLPPITGNGGKALVLASDLSGIEFATISDSTVITSNFDSETFNGTGAQTDFTLGFTPSTQNAVLVWVGGVRQLPGTDFTVSGTTLSFAVAPASGTNNIEVLNVAGTIAAIVPSDASVTTQKIQNNAVTLAKMENGTQGDIIIYTTGGEPTRLTTGTSGQVLTAGGAGADPSWQTPPFGFSKTDITGQTSAAIAVGDSIIFSDVSDSDNLKKNTFQAIVDLVAGTKSLTANGYIKIGEFYVQWGTTSTFSTSTTVTFPTPFPTACLWAMAGGTSSSVSTFFSTSSLATDQMTVSSGTGTSTAARWLSIGH